MISGTYKKNLSNDLEYKSFYPTDLTKIKFDSFEPETVKLLNLANRRLAELNVMSNSVKDLNLFIASYVRKEALYSSQIEGTQATLEDILDESNYNNSNADIEEAVNNVKAINYAVDRLKELPLCNRLLKETHTILMNGVRGSEKSPGEYRNSQNWIGHPGSTLKNAKYIPPNVSDMNECMNDLEKYINNDDINLDELIKIALIHYQFETIHPFLDGNGRIGRILITLYLIEKKIINTPCLYISYYLKRNQYEYYDKMSSVRIKDSYNEWINFFLKGIIEISEEAIECINQIKELREYNESILKPSDRWLLSFLESNPIIDARLTSNILNIDYYKVNRTIKKYIDKGVLSINNNSKKARSYYYEDYINILKQ